MRVISTFSHLPGIHCGSTAMRDLTHYIGLEFSEAMCFGLGSGLGFTYFRDSNGGSPSHVFHGRTATLERDLCRHLALDFEEGADDDADHAWSAAKRWIDRDIPVLLHTDLSYLPYYNTRTHFPGHRVVLAGYDDEHTTAFLADTQFPGLCQASYEALRDARGARLFPLSRPNQWLAINKATAPVSLADVSGVVLRDNALGMDLDRAPHQGIMGMELLAEDFENWAASPDWEFCARFGYQIIEKRGTGGGLFRKMYAQFLREAEAYDERVRAAGLADAMDGIANEWSEFAELLKRIAADKDSSRFTAAGHAIRHLAMREENFWGRVLDTYND